MLTPEQLARLRAMIDERCEALSTEIHHDADRSRDETYGELAGPVTDEGDKATADLISDLDSAELDRDLGELRQLEAAQEAGAAPDFSSRIRHGLPGARGPDPGLPSPGGLSGPGIHFGPHSGRWHRD